MSRPRQKNFAYVSGKKYDGMMGRCYRETESSYGNYGGRGIRVARSWIENIDSFRQWLEEELDRAGISKDAFIENSSFYQLDRINVNDHYTPTNCRLVSPQQNGRNKRASIKRILIAADGSLVGI